MNNQIVSVIIPVYQAEKYVVRCVESVINQTYKKLEVIMIDDGSEDNSLEICNEFAKKDSRIQIFHQTNMGVAAARNKGLDYAGGEYIYFLDSDDWIDKNTLADMVYSLEENNSDLCICGFHYIDGQKEQEHCFTGEFQVKRNVFMSDYFWKLYEDTILFNIGTKLYRRSLIEENRLRFHADMVIYEDIRFCLEYLDKAESVYLRGKPYYNYFQGNMVSITHSYKVGFWESTSVYCDMLIERFDKNSSELKKAVLLCLYRAYLQECRNREMKRKELCQMLQENCFPVAQRLNLGQSRVSELSMDQKVFMKLISKELLCLLWPLAVVVSVKNK